MTQNLGRQNTMKKRLYGQDIMKGEWPGGGGKMSNAIAGGSAWPSAKIGADGKFSGEDLHSGVEGSADTAGISIFDPVLCELMYTWFSPKEAMIVDPFAGGSVRGIVASKLNRNYIGVELRKEQVDANKVQGEKLCNENMPVWHCSDSMLIDRLIEKESADFIFSCPPYADLEVYSDDPADISNMPYDQFLASYRSIIAKTCSTLKNDRFACFVVGDVRDKKTGEYRGFVADTIRAFTDCGLKFYNEAILINAVGSLAIRAGKTFKASRKLGKTHQNILVFVKGDYKKATQNCGEVFLPDNIGIGEQIED
jgi:16S rRNA G966 N2-methylase RsmD